jgi:MoaA/NifB/PqqE/SkfB family radical SAM enzyme
MQRQADLPSGRIGRLTRAFRREYYAVVERVLRTRTQVLPCYCGYATAHLAPNGDVWMCCVIAEPAGNLRESGGRFLPVWRSPKAEALRRPIRAGRCFCPLANAAYVNLLFSPRSMARIGIHLLKDALWPFS